MISRRTLAVVKREARAQILTKTFVIATVTLPLLMLLLMAFMMTIGSVENSDQTHITIVTQDADLEAPLRQRLDDYNFVQSGQYSIVYRHLDVSAFEALLEAERPDLLQDNDRGIFFIPARATANKEIRFYSANPQNEDVKQRIGSAINAVLNRQYFRDKDINLADLDFVQKQLNIEGVRVTKDGSANQNYGNLLIAAVFVCLLMISIFFVTGPLPGTIIGEKSNRIAEILVSSMTPQELYAGKLLAGVVTGITQMGIWLLSFWLLIWVTTDVLPIPEQFRMTLSVPVLGYFVLNHLVGILTFMTIFAGLSSIYDNIQDANAVVVPSVFLVLIPFYATFTLLGNPANSLAEALSIFPFTSLYVMPARIALIDVPVTDILIALAVNLGVFYVLLKGTGKIYQIGIMTTGRKPSMKEVLGWLRG